MTKPETQLDGYFAKFGPPVAGLGKDVRARLRARLPGLFEIVYFYERQHSLVLSYSPSEQGFEGLCSIALDPRRVRLCFGQGARLSKADPGRLLQGRGTTVRYVELKEGTDLERPELEALMAAAVKLANVRLDPSAKPSTIFRVEAQQARARRAATAARPAAARGSAKTRR